MADVFVSYSRKDKARVAPLVAALEAQAYSVWWDPAISPGQEFDRQIATELDQARAVLVIWTDDSVESRWVRGEARAGADRRILIPVRFGATTLPVDFRAFHTIDLTDGPQVERSYEFQEVVRALDILIRRSDPAPVVPPAVAALAAAAERPADGSSRVGICVLPFVNLGGDPDQEFFSDGITGDIITELSRWRMLTVRSQSTASRFRDRPVDPMRVARDLGVRYVVDGSVRRVADRIRITAQLIDGETGSQVWAEKFDCAQADIFAIQDKFVQRITGTVAGRLQMADAVLARRKPPTSLAAYECVQRGNALPWDEPQAAAEATELFRQAIALDPGYAIAHALLGTMLVGTYRDDATGSTAALDEAYALTKRAVELDDSDSTCHSLLAYVCLCRRAYELALQHMHRSVELNPNNPWNHADMGLVLTYAGDATEALAWLDRAREIDSYFDPPWYWRQRGQACMVLHRHAEALDMFAHLPSPTDRALAYMAACHARLGEVDRARQRVEDCLAARPGFSTRQFMSKEPFRKLVDSEYLAESLRLAGLPD
ncbi:MAG: TIR domain-containing protein [Steroidobacteraceae bacterium]